MCAYTKHLLCIKHHLILSTNKVHQHKSTVLVDQRVFVCLYSIAKTILTSWTPTSSPPFNVRFLAKQSRSHSPESLDDTANSSRPDGCRESDLIEASWPFKQATWSCDSVKGKGTFNIALLHMVCRQPTYTHQYRNTSLCSRQVLLKFLLVV